MHSAENSKYAKTHEWAHMEGDTATVGISDHAQQEIGDIVFIDLPKVGQQVTAGQNCCVIESVKSASEIYAPVSGEVVEVNEALKTEPGLVNQEPHGKGWLFKIKSTAKPDGFVRLQRKHQIISCIPRLRGGGFLKRILCLFPILPKTKNRCWKKSAFRRCPICLKISRRICYTPL